MADPVEGLKAALETTKQIITLSTGVITLTVTFLEKIVQPTAKEAARHVPWALKGGWICFGISLACAIWTLMAITGSLNALDREARKLPLNAAQQAAVAALADGSNIRIPALLMLFLFAVGMFLTVATGFFL